MSKKVNGEEIAKTSETINNDVNNVEANVEANVEDNVEDSNELLNLKITSVRVVPKSEDNNLRANMVFIRYDKPYKCFEQNPKTMLYEESESKEDSMSVGVMVGMLSGLSDELALIMSMPIEAVVTNPKYAALSDMEKYQMVFAKILINSAVKMDNEFHELGFVPEEGKKPIDRDQYFHDIVDILLCKKAREFVSKKFAEIDDDL